MTDETIQWGDEAGYTSTLSSPDRMAATADRRSFSFWAQNVHQGRIHEIQRVDESAERGPGRIPPSAPY